MTALTFIVGALIGAAAGYTARDIVIRWRLMHGAHIDDIL